MTTLRTKAAIIAAVFGLALAAWLAGLSAFINDIAAMSPPPAAEKLDAIVVLTGGTNRIDTGFDLLQQGYGKKLFISGVNRAVDLRQLLKNWKEEPQKRLDCCVVLGFEAGNTAENAVETAAWLQREGFHSIYLVTANYHIRRALLEFSRFAPDVAVTPYAAIPEKAEKMLIMKEYTKYLAAWLRSLA